MEAAKTLEFGDKAALVTGATSGIGRATALLLAERGARVAVAGRKREALDAVTAAIRAKGGEAIAIQGDVTVENDRVTMVEEAGRTFRRLDVLVNAAGILASGSLETTSRKTWDQMMDVNVTSIFRLMQQALPWLEAVKGNVVNVSSVTGLRSFPGVLAYCVSKAALDQLTRCAALELAAKGVRVNAVNPGVTVTEVHKRAGMDDAAYAAFLEKSKTTHPMGRVGDAKEIAELIAFLANGERAGWITGDTVSIDGGRALTCAR